MFSSMFSRVAVVASLVAAAVAQTSSNGLSVLSPGGDNLWWVTKSDNTLVWSCHTTTLQNFTVLIANSNTGVVGAAPEPIIAIQPNYDCSLSLTDTQVVFTPSTGYTVLLADPFNSTHVYASSAPFEIKAFGSSYPDTAATPTQPAGTAAQSSSGSSATGSGSAGTPSSSSSTNTAKSGALANQVSVFAVALVGAGLAAFLA